MEFLDRALNFDYKLTDLEDEMIRYISLNQEVVVNSTIVELAKKFFTVPNTVTRLCHKLEYSGFSELKNELRHELVQSEDTKLPQKELLIKNFELIDVERERKVVQLMKQKQRINFFSIGQTAYATKIFVDNFYAIDYKFFFYTYANELRHKIQHSENELFFFVSLSGEKEQVVELAQEAKAKGHTVVSLTNLSSNHLAKLADINLFCYSPEIIINNYNITDKTPLLIIMNSLFQVYLAAD